MHDHLTDARDVFFFFFTRRILLLNEKKKKKNNPINRTGRVQWSLVLYVTILKTVARGKKKNRKQKSALDLTKKNTHNLLGLNTLIGARQINRVKKKKKLTY